MNTTIGTSGNHPSWTLVGEDIHDNIGKGERASNANNDSLSGIISCDEAMDLSPICGRKALHVNAFSIGEPG
jgi:hypothetical protein